MKGLQRSDAAGRQRQPGRSAQQREQHALGEHLPRQPDRARPQRRPHGHLAFPVGAAGQQEVGDIGARDQQYESNRSQEHQQGGPHLADHLLLQAGAP